MDWKGLRTLVEKHYTNFSPISYDNLNYKILYSQYMPKNSEINEKREFVIIQGGSAKKYREKTTTLSYQFLYFFYTKK